MKLKVLLMLAVSLLDVAFCLPLLRASESSPASLTVKNWIVQFHPLKLWPERQGTRCILQSYRD